MGSMKAAEYARVAIESILNRQSKGELIYKGLFDYPQGVFLAGMEQIYNICHEEKYFEHIQKWMDDQIDRIMKVAEKDGWSVFSALDFRKSGTLLFGLYDKTGDEKYLKVAEQLAESMKSYPVNEYGGFWHTKWTKDEMWLDGLYMAGPFLTMYAAYSGKEEYYDMVANQLLVVWEHTRDPESGLPRHGWDCSKGAEWADPVTGLSEEIWGRALGWYTVAMCDILDYFPKDHKKYQRIVDVLNEFLKLVIQYQDEADGRWYQVVDKGDRNDNWLENSCSCLLTYAIAKAVKKGYLEAEYMDNAIKGYEGVIRSLKYDEDGNMLIGDICVGTCIDSGTYEHYVGRATSVNDLHGSGAFILMCSQFAEG